jgi:signal transduction histidine kinase
MTSAELHANSFQTLIDNNAPRKVPEPVNVAVTVIISLLTVYVVLALKPAQGLWIIIAALSGLAATGTGLLAFFDIWIDLAHPFLAIFLCYYFFIPYRLIIENRKSWEYLQKNKLLQQVEELKTNFISMMSHDLKTPIARIQGMTEVILKDDIALSNTQREAVDTIKSSSDDLLKFINSILQYGRIESQGVELNKKSKDINQLLADVIKKHEFLARVKKIKIQTEFEPLFPVQVDTDLIRQVFSNLIENAIKYSPEDSTVFVRSKEENNKIIVDVIDQGMGIPAVDLPNIFMKFFRSHNVKTSTIKGTGLGLYLAQYFVQLHKGEILVSSEPEKGSCFTVSLPLNS